MRVTLCSIGKLRRGPHKDLLDHYATLLRTRGPEAGLTDFRHIEIDNRKSPAGDAGRKWEAEKLLAQVPDGGVIVALDETGTALTSAAFADALRQWRDESLRDVVFLIGGPYGHGDAVRSKAVRKLALGPATWPHRLVPLLITEQLYRASCILTGHPYHHD